MSQWIVTDKVKKTHVILKKYGYYVFSLYCKDGEEIDLANEINDTNKIGLAIPVLKVQHMSKQGFKYNDIGVALKSIVLVFVQDKDQIFDIKTCEHQFKILELLTDHGSLFGKKKILADYMFEHFGVIPSSRAYYENKLTYLLDGPIVDFKDCIVKIDYHKKNAYMCFDLQNKMQYMTLAFDIIDL